MRAALGRSGRARGRSWSGTATAARWRWPGRSTRPRASTACCWCPRRARSGRAGSGLSTDLLANPLTGPVLARALPSAAAATRSPSAASRRSSRRSRRRPAISTHLRLDLVLAAFGAARQRAAARGAQGRGPGDGRRAIRRSRMPLEIVHGTADEIVPVAIHSEPLARAGSRRAADPARGASGTCRITSPCRTCSPRSTASRRRDGIATRGGGPHSRRAARRS